MILPHKCPHCSHTIQVELKGRVRTSVSCPECENDVPLSADLPIGPGVIIGNGYKLENKIGESHLGDIYFATKKDGNKKFRVEILSGAVATDEENVTRFLQEVELLNSLQHENLVSATESGQDNETYFLVTDYDDGETLEERLKNGVLEEKKALEYLIEIAKALDYVWEDRKLLHRDIKPQNIFITKENRIKLTGFGIAKSSDEQSMSLTGVGFTIGTPEYMSPEQIRASDDLDFRSDMYSLGVVMYESLVGELPFVEDAPILLMQKHMDEVPVPVRERNSAVSSLGSALIDKILEKDREDRFESWQDIVKHAKKALASPTEKSVKRTKTSSPKASNHFSEQNAAPLKGKSPLPMVIAITIAIVIVMLVAKALGIF